MAKEKFGPVDSEKALIEALGQIRQSFGEGLLLLRGQSELHETIRSGRARSDFRPKRLSEQAWNGYLRYILGLPEQASSGSVSQSILQHYGLATNYVDLTTSAEVAAWFAVNEYKPRLMQFNGSALRSIPQATYEKTTRRTGFVLVLGFKDFAALLRQELLFDLTHLPENFARPHRQAGWLMYDHPAVKPTPSDYWIATIEIDRGIFKSSLSMRDVFPDQTIDEAYRRMLSLPFVQTPAYYFNRASAKNEKHSEMMDNLVFANPCVEVPEYYDDDGIGDHKWSDYTLYEPKPMRLWKMWRYDLAKDYPGVQADVRDATKITLSPTAWARLREHAREDCEWPPMDSDALFFTFAAIDHDKVGDHTSPYWGKWLVKNGELIVEKDMESDEKELSVIKGHGYLLRNGKLELCSVQNACECGHPELHLNSIRSLLQLPRLAREGKLLLLPHPKLSKLGWYVVITENDQQALLESVASFRRVVSKINETLISNFEPNTPAS